MKYFKYIFFVFLLILFFLLGFFMKDLAYKKNFLSCANNICYQRGWANLDNYINKRYSNNRVGEKINERNFINGTIQKIGNNMLIIKYNPFELVPDHNLLMREVDINNTTKIEKLIKKNNESYAEEVAQYKKKTENSHKPVIVENYPKRYIYINGLFTDFRVGQKVFIQSDKNIIKKKKFNASLVRILN